MADPFIGEIKAFGFSYAPRGWATCDGQLLLIQQNAALFSLLGTFFGGDGKTNFNLPNLQGRAPMGFGASPGLTPRGIGESFGEATVQLTANNHPPHTHALNAYSAANADKTIAADMVPSKGYAVVSGRPKAINTYAPVASGGRVSLAADGITPFGTATPPHENMQPHLPVLLCIALTGIYPSRS